MSHLHIFLLHFKRKAADGLPQDDHAEHRCGENLQLVGHLVDRPAEV